MEESLCPHPRACFTLGRVCVCLPCWWLAPEGSLPLSEGTWCPFPDSLLPLAVVTSLFPLFVPKRWPLWGNSSRRKAAGLRAKVCVCARVFLCCRHKQMPVCTAQHCSSSLFTPHAYSPRAFGHVSQSLSVPFPPFVRAIIKGFTSERCHHDETMHTENFKYPPCALNKCYEYNRYA